jgi:hypothetical protein
VPLLNGYRPLFRRLAVLLALSWNATAALAQTQPDPRLSFVEQRTPHFVIYSHPGEEVLARRLADMVEEVRQNVAATLGLEAPALTHIVLADQWDYSNGYATVLPRAVIFMNVSAPSGADVIGRTDDWLRLLLVHEYTHIVHLDQSRRWAGLLRRVFGRTPLAFPNVFLPRWHVEGLATYVESHLTGQGRLHAGEFRAIDRVAATARRFDPIDRVDLGLVTWPGPTGVYAYGLGFTAYLSDRFGLDSLGTLAQSTAGGRYSSAFRRVFGAPPRQLWNDYKTALGKSAASAPPATEGIRRLTTRGQQVSGPRFVAPSCDGCPPDVVYSIAHPDAFPEIRLVDIHGLVDRSLATRVQGSTVGRIGNSVVYDQLEYRRNVGVYADLWRLDRETGRTTPLSHELRLLDPDVATDGRMVAVRQSLGRRDLVLAGRADAGRLTETDLEVIASAPETQYYAPRWSPDGTRIVVERRRPGHLSEVVVIDVAGTAPEVVFADATTRLVTPTWHPNGTTVVAAADFDGRPFDLYELIPGRNDVRRLTHTDGARWPDVSPDGRTLVFVGYTADGHDVFSVPYRDRDGDRRTLVPPVTSEPAPAHDPSTLAMSVPERYSPVSTLLPTSWFPVLASAAGQVRFGAGTFGVDVLGRHTVSASASWLATVGADVNRRTRPPAWRPDGVLSYAYTRYRPRVGLIGMGSTTFVRVDGETASTLAPRWRREGELRVDVPLVHALRSATMSAAVAATRDRFDLATSVREQQRLAGRFGVSVRTARTYGYSISPEDGVWAGAWVEQASVNDRSRGRSGSATTTAVDVRGYLPGGVRRAVVATRAVAARSTGISGTRTELELGAAPAGAPPPTSVGSGALGLLRGFPAGAFAGTGLVSFSSDYRVPLWRIERGIGQQWIFARWLHASVFADAGRVWTDTTEDRTWKRSWGGELSVALVVNELAPITASSGIAWGHDGRTSRGPTGYIRIGRAF